MPPLLKLQKLPGKGDGVCQKKVSLRRFLADQMIASLCVWGGGGCFWGASYSMSLLPDTF